MKRFFRQLLKDDQAATAVEYAVMLGLVILVCLATVLVLGANTKILWEDNQTGLQKAFTGTSP
ncbi:MAG: Flp family type IVb pilin [Planctomycetales bacterium]|nr:Flp family type IVb pilin [Planctomycetales bacterium]